MTLEMKPALHPVKKRYNLQELKNVAARRALMLGFRHSGQCV